MTFYTRAPFYGADDGIEMSCRVILNEEKDLIEKQCTSMLIR
jgi:hypothetical protein